MSRLATRRDYERELANLAAVIEELGEPDDPASDLALRSYQTRLSELKEELEELGDEGLPGHELDVVLTGRPVREHSIEADFLSTILGDLQTLVRSLVGATHGKTEKQVRLGPKIEGEGTLRLAGTFAGSFGMHLEAIQEQPTFPAISPVAEAFQILVDLLEAPEDSAGLLERLAPAGPRATRHYRELLKHLDRRHAGLDVEWPSVAGPRRVTLAHERAAKIIRRLERIRERQYGRVVEGHLYLGDDRDNRFGIETDTEAFQGAVSPDLIADVVDYFGKDCRAYISITEVEDTVTSDIRRSYRLLELAAVDEKLPHEREP